MARGTDSPADPDALVRGYVIYDRAVDIVSIYHWLFTETKELPSTVEHFERYPKLKTSEGELTPDFTVLFKNGTGWVAEIANIALPEGSVESICRQLDKYSRVTHLPNARGGTTEVSKLDVVLLTPIDNATDAVRRIYGERIENPDHWYSPARRPIMIQFAPTPDHYVLQVWPGSQNGSFSAGGEPNYRDWVDLKPPPRNFANNKVRYAFANDPIPPLYLATRLWLNVFPSRFGVSAVTDETTTDEVLGLVRHQYGRGRVGEVDDAMKMLRAAGLVTFADGIWKIRRRRLSRTDSDAHVAIAQLASGARTVDDRSRTRMRRELASQPTLFDENSMGIDAV